MSQSLIVFEPSGQVLYQHNNKITPFNELIYSLVAESCTELDSNFYTTSGTASKRFYCLKRESIWAAIYFDLVTTVDSDKIRLTLADVLRTYAKLHDEDTEKMGKLIDFQFANLVRLKADDTPSASGTSTPRAEPVQRKKAPAKKMRKWVNGELVDADVNDDALDYSATDATQAQGAVDESLADVRAFKKQDDLVLVSELQDVLDEESDSDDEAPATGFFSKISSYFGSAGDVNEISKKFYDQLISKNIAPPTATAILDKIKSRLGHTVTAAVFKQALTEELTKVLTPNVLTDLLYDIKRNQKKNTRPYVISVVGVNGVGKSTNLAKLAYWFLQNNMNVLICACDTFRSGAVEQLKVHVNNLQRLNASSDTAARIELFEKGYGGGDHVANTARLAIQHAEAEHYDIVLIDTAGRTHSNAKLMAPLKKFGDAANPDKIIMVGEALVGTDSVEQAVNFNNAFGNRRGLDFFIISKVDTVGDLVGAMINMVMATRVPILFVGTGQTYTDIKKLSVKQVVEMLTS